MNTTIRRRLVSVAKQAPFDTAPERASDLRQLILAHNVTFEFDDAAGDMLFDANPRTGVIRIGVAVLERLWAFCYAYTVLLEECLRHGKGRSFEFGATPETEPARLLLAWAHKHERASKSAAWPNRTPSPTNARFAGPEWLIADITYVRLLGWILLHEVGHCVLRHQADARTTRKQFEDMERQADEWASDWMLKKSSAHSQHIGEFVVRTNGAAIGLAVITSLELHDRQRGGQFHPDPIDRLMYFLTKHVHKDGGRGSGSAAWAWWMAVAIVQAHLMETGKALPLNQKFSSCRHFLETARFVFD